MNDKEKEAALREIVAGFRKLRRDVRGRSRRKLTPRMLRMAGYDLPTVVRERLEAERILMTADEEAENDARVIAQGKEMRARAALDFADEDGKR